MRSVRVLVRDLGRGRVRCGVIFLQNGAATDSYECRQDAADALEHCTLKL